MAQLPKITEDATKAKAPSADGNIGSLQQTLQDLLNVQKAFFQSFTYLKSDLTGKIEDSPEGFRNKKTGKFASKAEYEAQFLPEAPEFPKTPKATETPKTPEATETPKTPESPTRVSDGEANPTKQTQEDEKAKTAPIPVEISKIDGSETTFQAIRVSIDSINENIIKVHETAHSINKNTNRIDNNLYRFFNEYAKNNEERKKAQEEAIDKAQREKKDGLLSSLMKFFGSGAKKKAEPKEKKPTPKGLFGMLGGLFGITDLLKAFTPITGIIGSLLTGIFSFIPKIIMGLMPMLTGILKSLFGGPLGIVASIGLLINDFFKGLDFAEALDVSKTSGVIGAIFGGDMEGGLLNAFKNAGKWAIMGATIGSFVPVVGTIAGGIVGAALGGIMGWIGGGQIALWMESVGNAIANWWDSTVVGLFDVKDAFAGAWDKFKLLVNNMYGTIIGGVLNFMADMMSMLAEIEIPVGNFLEKVLPSFAYDLISKWLPNFPKTIKPFGMLAGTAESVRGTAAGIQESSKETAKEIAVGQAIREEAATTRQEELGKKIEERATQLETSQAKYEEIKQKGKTPAAQLEPGTPSTGGALDTISQKIQTGKEMAARVGNLIAPVTNNVVTTKGSTNNIVQGMPSSRSSESTWIRSQNKNYVPS